MLPQETSQDSQEDIETIHVSSVTPEDTADPIGLHGTCMPSKAEETEETVKQTPTGWSNTASETSHEKQPLQPPIAEKIFLERYELEDEIGRGGMGRVYMAKDLQTGAKVVIKILSRMKQGDFRWLRFRREVQALSILNHPNIVKIIDHGSHWEDPNREDSFGRPFIVMEYIPGLNLSRTVKRMKRDQNKCLPVAEVIPLFRRLAGALVSCHSKGLVHRDIKPGNVVVDERSGEPKLVDFGLVRADLDDFDVSSTAFKENITRTGQAIGTPLFMSPEQLFGRKSELGKAADVWGFGASLYYSLTGAYPYTVNTPGELADVMESSDPDPLKKHDPTLPDYLNEFCRQCLVRDPNERLSIDQAHSQLKAMEAALNPTRLWLVISAAVVILVLLLGALAKMIGS